MSIWGSPERRMPPDDAEVDGYVEKLFISQRPKGDRNHVRSADRPGPSVCAIVFDVVERDVADRADSLNHEEMRKNEWRAAPPTTKPLQGGEVR